MSEKAENIIPISSQEQVARIEVELISLLVGMRVIGGDFTGSVTLHFNQGGLTDIDRLEKSLKKKLFK